MNRPIELHGRGIVHEDEIPLLVLNRYACWQRPNDLVQEIQPGMDIIKTGRPAARLPRTAFAGDRPFVSLRRTGHDFPTFTTCQKAGFPGFQAFAG
jgi:hypothetical protein